MTTNTDKLAAQICRDVAELPDRNSPEDWPEAMLVTHEELRAIVLEALEAAGRVQQAEPVGEIYSHNCNSLGIVHAVVRFDGPFDPNSQHTWPAQGAKVYLVAPHCPGGQQARAGRSGERSIEAAGANDDGP